MIQILLARKPIDKKTVAENVLEYGTGGININESRIKHKSQDDFNESMNKNRHKDFNSHGGIKVPTKGIYSGDNRPPENYDGSQGRFPANMIFGHHPGCKCIGTKEVKSDGHYSYKLPDDGGLMKLGLNNLEDLGNPNAINGNEIVENWECHKDCKVKELDEKSGVSKSTGGSSGHTKAYSGGYKKEYYGDKLPGFGDVGTASRFFKIISQNEI